MFPGYASRIDLELRKLYIENNLKFAKSKKIKIFINIIDNPRRKYSAFIGATILSELSNIPEVQDYWISKHDWDEAGPNIVLKKCKNIVN